MKKNTKLLIALLLLIVIVLIIYQLTRKPSSPSTPMPSPTLENVPQFPEDPISAQVSQTIFRFPSQLPNTPSQLPIYTIEYLFSLNTAVSVAQNLGFTSEFVSNPNYPNRFVWTNQSGSRLIVLTNPPSLSLISTTPTSSPSPSVTIAQSLVGDFLSANNIALQPFNQTLIDSGYLIVDSDTTHPQTISAQNQANLTFLNLQYSLNNYPVYLEPKSSSSITAKITGGNQFTSLSIFYPPNLKDPVPTTIIDSYLAATALQNGRGSLVSADYQSIQEASKELVFSQVNIQNIDLIYTPNESGQYLIPVYRFMGLAQLNDQVGSPPVNVTYLVSAIPTTP